MSELTSRLRRMLSQAQVFANDAPMEAVARAKLLVNEAHAAVGQVSENERDEVLAILQIARKRVARYEAKLSEWQRDTQQRADLFVHHERERYQQSIPEKV